MITDNQTNFLYLSLSSRPMFAGFRKRFTDILNENHIFYSELEKTKDIWCRDFMPIQIDTGKYVQLRLTEDYYPPAEKMNLYTDPKPICDSLNIHPKEADIYLDGGNVIKGNNKVIITDKVFKDNPRFNTRTQLIEHLNRMFEIDEVIIIPREPDEEMGHADGLVRFLDENTVLVSKEKADFWSESYTEKLFGALARARLNTIQVPYAPLKTRVPKKYVQPATGDYINFLSIGNITFLPQFDIPEDEMALKIFSKHLGQVIPVNCNEVAEEGGVLNCISWNVQKTVLNSHSKHDPLDQIKDIMLPIMIYPGHDIEETKILVIHKEDFKLCNNEKYWYKVKGINLESSFTDYGPLVPWQSFLKFNPGWVEITESERWNYLNEIVRRYSFTELEKICFKLEMNKIQMI